MPYSHFTNYERNALQAMLGMGLGKDWIARVLGKHISSVYREIGRNRNGAMYVGLDASYKARKRQRETKPRPKRGNKALMKLVDEGIGKDWSPEQIAGRMKKDYPLDEGKRISPETIYQYFYERMAKEPGLKVHMRHPRLHRSSRVRRKGAKSLIKGRV
jgi:IS30 family transposase